MLINGARGLLKLNMLHILNLKECKKNRMHSNSPTVTLPLEPFKLKVSTWKRTPLNGDHCVAEMHVLQFKITKLLGFAG